MNFKDIVARDVQNTFLNVNEFADVHEINGRRLKAVVDKSSSEGEVSIKFHGQITRQKTSLYNVDVTVYVSALEFPRPKTGSLISLDGRKYLTQSVSELGGMYQIKLQIAGGR